MKYQCLIVDDEIPLANSTAEYFNLFDVATYAVYNETDCLNFFNSNSAELILLDINLENSSGFDLCKKLRQQTKIPILFISARQSDDDILLALNIGGDDYIRKPYTLSVLLAKVRAVLKRCSGEEKSEETIVIDNLLIDLKLSRAFLDGVPLKLKAMEYKLLCYLALNSGRVIPKDELFLKVWGDSFVSDGTLNVHVRHLREQIEKEPNNPKLIKTIWGTGYLFGEQG